jgi:hypothetical protein
MRDSRALPFANREIAISIKLAMRMFNRRSIAKASAKIFSAKTTLTFFL